MNTSITNEEIERIITETEQLYRKGENRKAATLLIDLMERVQNDGERGMLAMVILENPLPPELAMRMARAANGNNQIIDAIFANVGNKLAPEIATEIRELQGKSLQQSSSELEMVRNAETQLDRRQSVSEAEDSLIKIIERTKSDNVRSKAVWALCRHPLRPDFVLRIAKASRNNDNFISMLSKPAALSAGSVRELVTWMALNDSLNGDSHYSDLARSGRLSDDFVPSIFGEVKLGMHHTLLVLASEQLRARANRKLHQFMLSVIFGDYPTDSRNTAGMYLSNAYDMNPALERDRFRLSKESIQMNFQSVGKFSSRLTAWLENPKFRQIYSVERDYLNDALTQIDPALGEEFARDPESTNQLRRAMQTAIDDKKLDPEFRHGLQKLIKLIGTDLH